MTIAATNHLLVLLDGAGCSVEAVGGKAAGLDRLAAHGFPIPRSYVLTADAYRSSVDEAGFTPWIDDLAARPAPEPGMLAAEEAEIAAKFAAMPIPGGVVADIEEAATALLGRGRVAVRSSATAEDLGAASFAGQYRTFVGVDDLAAVVDAVKRCWASLWAPSARDYRRRHGIEDRDLAMAVVIQEMIEAAWSGVAFTRDPAGNRDLMRIEMVPGAGEALVSGSVTPLDFTISRTTLAVVRSRGGEPPAFLENLSRMLLRVEDDFDAPQDVEWSWRGEGIALLQARPVTVGGPTAALDDGFDRPVGSDDLFTPHGVVEMLPGVVPPLLWTINAPMIESGFRDVVAGLGGTMPPLHRPFVARFRGRCALNLGALRDVASSIAGGSAAAVEEQFLGRALSGEEEAPTPAGRRSLRRARRAQRRLVDEVALVCGAADALVELHIDLRSLPARRLLAYGHEVRDLAWRIAAAEVAASSAASASFQALQSLLGRWFPAAEAATWAQRLTAGGLGGEVAGTRITRLLAAVRRDLVDPHPDLAMAVATLPPHRVASSLLEIGDRGAQLASAVRGAARLAGSKAIYGGPTWEEDMPGVWARLTDTAALPATVESAHAELVASLTAGKRWRLIRVLTGQIVDLRLRWVDRLTAQAVAWLQRRERAKTAMLTLGGEERRIIAESARRLAASSHVASADDVHLHSDAEVKAMLLGAASVAPSVLHWRRRVLLRSEEAPQLPEVFSGSPDRAPLPTAAADTHILSGWAASPGRATGTARVVLSPADANGLCGGDILVAPATDPSWTPILSRVGGIVLETGGPLSHAAIVARELGIPAVLCITAATTVIHDGEDVEVDGYAGVVSRALPAADEETP